MGRRLHRVRVGVVRAWARAELLFGASLFIQLQLILLPRGFFHPLMFEKLLVAFPRERLFQLIDFSVAVQIGPWRVFVPRIRAWSWGITVAVGCGVMPSNRGGKSTAGKRGRQAPSAHSHGWILGMSGEVCGRRSRDFLECRESCQESGRN
jgi:hypothetical protein